MSVESIFKSRRLESIYDEIRQVYLGDNRPWILGFSGGKDSTCMVQLIWRALSSLPVGHLHKKIFIISSDTLVESPKVVEQITGNAWHDGKSGAKDTPSSIHQFGTTSNRGHLLGMPSRERISGTKQSVQMVY